ncbi:SRPBCC family protein [Austwickia chelonae]|uniref:SRPBCC family protein n=1 Tax=Austwickia chelonae TaxID=100225 RepID=UPI000E268888|nr:SRPBCC family protein [Austwickia chelonae]
MVHSTSVTISVDRMTAWEVISDPERWTEWMPDVDSVEYKSGARADYGSEYAVKAGIFASNNITITEHHSPDCISWKAENSDGAMTQTITLSANGDGTQTASFTLSMDSLLSKAVGVFAGSYYDKQLISQAAALRDYFTQRDPSVR